MRVEFVVSWAERGGWNVQRGQTSALHFPSLEGAMRASANMARNVRISGDTAIVKLVAGDDVLATETYAPEAYVQRTPRSFAPPRSTETET